MNVLLWARFAIVMTGMVILATGCSSGSESQVVTTTTQQTSADTAPTMTTGSSAKIRNLSPAPEQSTLDAVVIASNELGVSLSAAATGNCAYAPFPLSLSLAKLRAGATGPTRAAISSAMRLPAATTGADPAYNALELGITSRIAGATLAGLTSGSASASWGQTGYGYLLTYLDTLAENYGISQLLADFAHDQPTASTSVANWAYSASDGTGTAPSLDQDIRLVLGTGFRFNGAWDNPFDPAATAPGWFKTLDGTLKQVPFMHKTSLVGTTSGEGFGAVELPVAGNQRLLLIIPDEDRFAEVEAGLTAQRLEQIAAGLTPSTVEVTVPKFAITTSPTLDLGIAGMADTADFSGIDGTTDLYVAATTCRSKFSLDEAGIRANSATVFAVKDAHPETWTDPAWTGYGSIWYSGPGVNWINGPAVVSGRPFLWALRDAATGIILFMGKVLDLDGPMYVESPVLLPPDIGAPLLFNP